MTGATSSRPAPRPTDTAGGEHFTVTSRRNDGTGRNARSDLWISCAYRHAWNCAPQLHGIFETVEKVESLYEPHHLNVCVPPCLPTDGTIGSARNDIAPLLDKGNGAIFSFRRYGLDVVPELFQIFRRYLPRPAPCIHRRRIEAA